MGRSQEIRNKQEKLGNKVLGAGGGEYNWEMRGTGWEGYTGEGGREDMGTEA